jgi:hypothetical protein
MFACFFARDHDHGPAVCVACRLPVEQHRLDGDAAPAEDGQPQEGAALAIGTVVAPDAGVAVVPVTAQVVGAAPGAPAPRGPCPRTRAELDGHLERCGYGEDAALFAEHFERGAGAGQEEVVRCGECRLPIAQHRLQHRATSADDGAVAGVVVPRVPAPSQTVREGNFDCIRVHMNWPVVVCIVAAVLAVGIGVGAASVRDRTVSIIVAAHGLAELLCALFAAFQPAKHTVRIAREPAGSSNRAVIYDKRWAIEALCCYGCGGTSETSGTRYTVSDVSSVIVKFHKHHGSAVLVMRDEVEIPLFTSSDRKNAATLCAAAASEWRAYLRPEHPQSLV